MEKATSVQVYCHVIKDTELLLVDVRAQRFGFALLFTERY